MKVRSSTGAGEATIEITGRQVFGNKSTLDTSLPFNLQNALDEIESIYGDTCYIKPKSLAKFGSNVEVPNTGYATLMTLPSGTDNETYPTGNDITTVSSSNAGDTQNIVIEGHTLSGSNLTFVSQTATLNGQSQVTLATPLYRMTRIHNDDSTDFAGSIYGYQTDTTTGGVPDTDSKVHLIVPQGENQSFKGATSLSSQDYWLITGISAAVNEKTSASVDVELQIREFGKVFRTQLNLSVESAGTGSFFIPLDPVIIAPKNSDVRMRAKSSAASTSVSARIKGYLALVQ